MATSFFLRTTKTSGYATLFVRLQSPKQGINHKAASNIEVDIKAWNNAKKGNLQMSNFLKQNPQIAEQIDELRLALDATLSKRNGITQEEFKQIIEDVQFRKAREAERKRKEEEAAAKAAAERMTLNKFIKQFHEDARTGKRLSFRGKVYSEGSLKSNRCAIKKFELFQKAMKKQYDFEDIDMEFYKDYTAWLAKQNYQTNTIGKCIKEFKMIMAVAQSEGYHHNEKYKDRRFKGTRVDVDSIYLTRDELDKIMAIPDEKLTPVQLLVRDVFMIGVWTAQRVSDYNDIKKEDIQTTTKRWIEDIPDPEHEGQTMAVVRTKEIMYINFRQQKTGTKVAIPCSSELKSILEKYGYNIPHTYDQLINKEIKNIGEIAGIDQPVEIATTKGGKVQTELFPKYKLIMSHTARRTGATLMYLSGMEAYDIMKITGHATEEMLRKYIKADQLEVVEKLSSKYEYFD